MIDPQNIVRYDYTDEELEELLIFCVCVAGKKASTIAPRVHKLFTYLQLFTQQSCPLKCGYNFPIDVDDTMKVLGIGCYTQKAETLYDFISQDPAIDLRTCTVEDLEKIKGIGPKTSRFFLMSSRPNVRYAALDTHLLAFLRDSGVENVPKSTPTGKKYLTLEQTYLKMVPEGMSPAEFDLVVWRKYSSKKSWYENSKQRQWYLDPDC